MHVNAHLDVDMVAVETEDEVSVLLELAAPAAEPTDATRPAATLQVVLDRSGSMAEDGRLEGAKTALLALIDRLEPTDNFGLVAFDDEALVVVPAGPLADKDRARAAVSALEVGGMTDLSSGYLRGLQEARRVAGAAGATVLLISDGHANQGVTDHDRLRGIAAQAFKHGVTTATLGYGLGYDELLLGAIADSGAGEALFAEDPDTAGKLISTQVEGLLAKSAQAASLMIKMHRPVASVFVMGGLPTVQLPDASVMVELGDLWAGETRKLLLRFHVPAMPALGLATVAELTLQYVELPSLDSHTVTLPISVNVVPGDQAAGRIPNPVVTTEAAFQQAQEAKRQASEALRHGDATSARSLLLSAGSTIEDAMMSAPVGMAADLSAEKAELDELADRALWDDTNRMSKETHSSWHNQTRKRGRPRPPESICIGQVSGGSTAAGGVWACGTQCVASRF
jgi:Ca-activated chloride channel family protein